MAKKPSKKVTKKSAKPAKKVAKKTAKKVTAVPSLSLPATGGQMVALNNLGGKKAVLYFYPKDMTPGCTIEGHEFTKLKNEFEAQNTVVYGVSRDSLSSHEKFKAKECYTIDLLSD